MRVIIEARIENNAGGSEPILLAEFERADDELKQLGLCLAEGRSLMYEAHRAFVRAQSQGFVAASRTCSRCGSTLSIKRCASPCHLTKSLEMPTIAEWAEDAETVETLVEIGIDHVQGYVIARPQTPERIVVAASAASFTKDEKLAAYVRTLGDNALTLAQMDLPAIAATKDLH